MPFFFYIARIKVSKSSPTDFVHEMTIPEVVTLDVITDVETFKFNLRRNRWHTRNIPVVTDEGNTWHSYIYDIQKVSICREDVCYIYTVNLPKKRMFGVGVWFYGAPTL
jgi:hypothetical protein